MDRGCKDSDCHQLQVESLPAYTPLAACSTKAAAISMLTGNMFPLYTNGRSDEPAPVKESQTLNCNFMLGFFRYHSQGSHQQALAGAV